MAKILLVEDNEMNRDLISRKLKRQGFEVVLAVDGAEGIEKANDEAPDLILMDMGLPILDGYAATRLLKGNEQTRGIPVIGLSAHAMSGDADKALGAGCDDYDTKPVEWDRLLPKIQKCLEKAHAAAARETELSDTATLDPSVRPGPPPARVLVVDDSPMHRDVLGRRLADLGYEHETAENALAAWQRLGEQPFDAVLLDVTLPGTSAREVLAQLKSDSRQGDVPVLVTCPVDAVDDAIGCLHLGADDYLPQPFHAEVLKARLTASLERRELRDKREIYDGVVSGEERHADHLLRVLFPEPIVRELQATRKILPRRHDDVAVLYCGVADFDVLCDVSDPLEVISSLQGLVAAYEDVLERHGVLKVKTAGEVLVAAAGLFPYLPDPVLEGVRCALALKEAAARTRPEWNLRIGLHAGPLIAGVVGRKRYQFDLWGSTIRTAAAVQARGAVNAVNVSAAVWRRLGGAAEGGALENPGGEDAIYRVDRLTA